MPELNIIAMYFRISEEDKDLKVNLNKDESNSISAQRALAYGYLEQQPDLNHYQIREFRDDGYSGTNMNRPALQEMLALVRSGCVSCILVKDMSRFGRNYVETGNYIEQIFPFLGIRFIAIGDHYDSLEHMGKTPEPDIAFKNILYDFYSKDLSLKVKSIKRMQQKEGKFLAAKPPYGYFISENNRRQLVIDPDSAIYVRLMFKMTLKGALPSEIANHLNQQKIPTPVQRNYYQMGFSDRWYHKENMADSYWTSQTVLKILKDDTMYGCTVNNRVRVKSVGSRSFKRQAQADFVVIPDTHEAIIDKDTFLCTQEIIRKRSAKRNMNRCSHENLFGGILYCGECHSRLRHEVHLRAGKEAVYYCRRARHTKGEGCNRKTIKDETLEQIVFAVLETHSKALVDWNVLNDQFAGQIPAVSLQTEIRSKQIEGLRAKMSLLYENYCAKQLSREDFLLQKEEIRSGIEKLQRSIKGNEALLVSHTQSKKNSADKWLETLKKKERKQELIDTFIEQILLYPSGKLHIVLKTADELTCAM